MSELIPTIQDQEIDDSLVELFDIYLPTGNTVHLFNGLYENTDNIYFPNRQGTDVNEYWAIPIQIEGVEVSGAGASARPTLSVANIPRLEKTIIPPEIEPGGTGDETTLDAIMRAESEGILSSEGIYTNEDLINSRVLYRKTLKSHLKVSTDDSSGLPVEFPPQKFVINRVESEEPAIVQFELTSPFDVEGVQLPNRIVNGRYCSWEYQGHELKGKGGCTWALGSYGKFYDIDDQLITGIGATILPYDPGVGYNAGGRATTITGNWTRVWQAVRNVPPGKNPDQNQYYWTRIDVCSKTISGCKARFQNIGPQEDTSVALPFGAFPGVRKFR